MNETYYNIGDIIFNVKSDLPYELPEGNAKNFRIHPTDTDFTYEFKKNENIAEYIAESTYVADAIFAHEYLNKNKDFFRGFLWKDNFYDSILDINWEKRTGIISYISSGILIEQFLKGSNFLNYLCLERIFTLFDALLLHSSHITIGDEALLFSAPSGTGKSTQAELWEKYENAKIINGDRTLLRRNEGIWYAYGCPMCGTSEIYLQSKKPLKAIIILEQSERNTLHELTTGEKFSLLYPQLTIQRWDRQMVLKNMELLENLIENIPIWKYSCTKDKDAVEDLKEALGIS